MVANLTIVIGDQLATMINNDSKYQRIECHEMENPARPPACYVARWEEEAALPLAQWGVLSLSRALVGSLYIKINIPKVPTQEDCRLPRRSFLIVREISFLARQQLKGR